MAEANTLELEMTILGCALNDSTCVLPLSVLPEDSFLAEECKAFHRAIKRLAADGKPVDIIIVSEEMRCDYPQPEAFVMECQQKGFMTSAYGTYEAKLLEYRRRRLVVQAATQALTDARTPAVSIDNICETLEKAIRDTGGGCGSMTMQDAVINFIDNTQNAGKGRCYTGVADLDRLTGGFRGGKLVVLGARPGVGKTALALYMTAHVAAKTGPVLVVSLEMDEIELATRFIACYSGVDAGVMESGRYSDDDVMKMAKAYGPVAALPIRINTHANTPLQVRRAAAEMKQSQAGLAMIVVDYIQLMRTDTSKKSRYEEVSEISRELKLLAQDMGVPVLALSQFNRSSEQGVGGKATSRMPTMAEAKDSGSIEQDANLFLIQYAPGEPGRDSGERFEKTYNFCEINGYECQILNVAKNRQGRTGNIYMAFDKPHMRFMCLQ